tara:strand:- start:717 stop:929 length:213 start_codon:yes stop_codon:yes gene_type:complete
VELYKLVVVKPGASDFEKLRYIQGVRKAMPGSKDSIFFGGLSIFWVLGIVHRLVFRQYDEGSNFQKIKGL